MGTGILRVLPFPPSVQSSSPMPPPLRPFHSPLSPPPHTASYTLDPRSRFLTQGEVTSWQVAGMAIGGCRKTAMLPSQQD